MVASPVTIGLGGTISAEDASKYLGVSYSHLINLIHAKKVRAQKKERSWRVEHSDLERFKSGMRPRSSKVRLVPVAPSNSPSGDTTDIKLTLPREKFELIKLACQSTDKTIVGILNEKLDSVYNQIKQNLTAVNF